MAGAAAETEGRKMDSCLVWGEQFEGKNSWAVTLAGVKLLFPATDVFLSIAALFKMMQIIGTDAEEAAETPGFSAPFPSFKGNSKRIG